MWVPYRNLFFLGLLQTRKYFSGAAEIKIEEGARHKAEIMVQAGFPSMKVYEQDSLYEDVWPKPSDGDFRMLQDARFSRELEAFILRGRRGSREVLDRLILAYASQGLAPEDVYAESKADYDSVRGVTKLSQEDVTNYGIFYWDFATLFQLRDGVDWLNRHGLYTESSILAGDISLDDVRATLGVERGLDFERRLRVLTYKNSRVMERILDQMLEMQKEEMIGQGRNATEYLKNSAAFVASAIAMMKLYRDSSESTDTGGSLADIIKMRMDAAAEESEAARKVPDWTALQRDDLTPEDLMAANIARRAGNEE